MTTLERQLERTDLDQATRCRLLASLVAELAGEDDPRPARAAAEAEAIARRLGDPDLLALALTAGTMAVNYEREPEHRAVLAAELGQIGHEHGLPEYEWYAEYIAGTAAAVLFAGAASTALAMQPVAQILGELSAFLGRPEAAAQHFAAAELLARRWNSPHWTARVRAAASRYPPDG